MVIEATMADRRLADRTRIQELVTAATFEVLEPRFPEIPQPVLVIVGELDTAHAHAAAGALAAAVSDGVAFEAPGTGRLVPLEAPAALGRTLRHFLERVGRPAAALTD
jgi:pimeloyl-ACP methyl ester carboxylesterase